MTEDWAGIPYLARWMLNHLDARDVPGCLFCVTRMVVKQLPPKGQGCQRAQPPHLAASL